MQLFLVNSLEIKCLLYLIQQTLAPAVTGVDLFEHIRNMLWPTSPAFIIAFIAFFILGGGTSGDVDLHKHFISTLEKNTTTLTLH